MTIRACACVNDRKRPKTILGYYLAMIIARIAFNSNKKRKEKVKVNVSIE